MGGLIDDAERLILKIESFIIEGKKKERRG